MKNMQIDNEIQKKSQKNDWQNFVAEFYFEVCMGIWVSLIYVFLECHSTSAIVTLAVAY